MEFSAQARTLDIFSDETSFRAQEVRTAKTLAVRIIGVLGGLAFLGGAAFFWVMEVDNPEETFWIRAILCGGLGLIGIALAWSSASKKRRFDFVEGDAEAGALFFGQDTDQGPDIKGRMRLDEIERVTVGNTSKDVRDVSTGVSVLYIEGPGAPRKGILLIAGHYELQQVRAHILRLSGASG